MDAAIFLSIFAALLFLFVKADLIKGKTLQTWANIAAIVAMLAAIIAFVAPAASQLTTAPAARSQPSSPPSSNLSVANTETATIKENQTEFFFNDELLVSVGDIWPIEVRTTLTVASPGYPNQRIENAAVGLETTYVGNHRYVVRILELDWLDNTAKVSVSKSD